MAPAFRWVAVFMSIWSGIRDKTDRAGGSVGTAPAAFSSDAIPYLLSTGDAFVILVSSVAGGIGYQLAIGNAVPNVLPHCAVGLLEIGRAHV